jgi:N-acetylmuramoyl-L-alanine amidase
MERRNRKEKKNKNKEERLIMKKNLKQLGLYSAVVSLLTFSLGFTVVKSSPEKKAVVQNTEVITPVSKMVFKPLIVPAVPVGNIADVLVAQSKQKEEVKPIEPKEVVEPKIGDSLPYYQVTTEFLNVRSQPSAKAKIADVLVKGWVVQVDNITDNGWYLLNDGGYVNGKFVDLIGDPEKVMKLLDEQKKKKKPEPKFVEPVPVTPKAVETSTRSNTNTNKNEIRTSSRFSSTELELLARLVKAEAGAEPYRGKVAVAIVVLNRIDSEEFPDTIHDVIYQRGQFSPVSNGMINRPTNDECRRAVAEAISSGDTLGGALFFYDPAHATSHWLDSMPTVTSIGGHVFKK